MGNANIVVCVRVAMKYQINDPELMDIAILPPSATGIPYPLWVGPITDTNGNTEVCVRVSNTPGRFDVDSHYVVLINPIRIITPQWVNMSDSDTYNVIKTIELNLQVIESFWLIYITGEGSVIPIYESIKKVTYETW